MANDNKHWIDNLSELDRAALLDLLDGDVSKLHKRREMVFCLYDIEDSKHAQAISVQIQKMGWETKVFKDPENESLYMLEAGKRDYIISEKNYIYDSNFFKEIAEYNGVYYDGWYASK